VVFAVAQLTGSLVEAQVPPVQDGVWAGSSLTVPRRSSQANFAVAAEFRRDSNAPGNQIEDVHAQIVGPAGLATGCAVPSLASTPVTYSGNVDDPDTASFATPIAFPCNGTYHVVTRACTDVLLQPRCDAAAPPANPNPDRWLTMTAVVDVVVAPGRVSGLTVKQTGRTATLSWQPPAASPPDLVGYIVERASSGAPYEVRTTTRTTTFADALPESGGALRWRVRAQRAAPGKPVTGDAAAAEVVSLEVAPVPSALPPAAAAASTTGVTPRRTTGSARTRTTTRNRPTTATTLDTGFDERLPYELDGEGDDPVIADEQSAATVHQGQDANAGLAVPIAAAMVLAVWGAHLRRLTKLARAP
jgi:hypothetical protein